MRRRAPLVVTLALAVLAGIVAGLLWLARDTAGTSARSTDAISVTGTVTPEVHVFGDRVEAEIVVVIDPAVVDAASVRVDQEFAPYEVAGRATVARSVSGGVGVVRFTYPLRCLREGCDALSSRGVVELPTGRVLYRFAAARGTAVSPLDWPPFEVVSRVSSEDVERIRWRAAEATLPPVTPRVDPAVLVGLVLLLAALLAGSALWLVQRVWLLPRTSAQDDGPVGDPRTRLEQALLQLREASRNGDSPLRRRALERVALELAAVGRPDLADAARGLAWSPGEATAGTLTSC